MIDLKSATLHETLLLNGTNLGLSLDPAKKTGLKLQFDPKKDHLIVWYKSKAKAIKNWQTIEPINPRDLGWKEPELEIKAETPQTTSSHNLNIQAQVSTPHSHVFANEPGLKVNR